MAWTVEQSKTLLESGPVEQNNWQPRVYDNPATFVNEFKLNIWSAQFVNRIINAFVAEFGDMMPMGTSVADLVRQYNNGVSNGLTMGLLLRK